MLEEPEGGAVGRSVGGWVSERAGGLAGGRAGGWVSERVGGMARRMRALQYALYVACSVGSVRSEARAELSPVEAIFYARARDASPWLDVRSTSGQRVLVCPCACRHRTHLGA